MKQLLGQNQGATNVEIDKESIRDFVPKAVSRIAFHERQGLVHFPPYYIHLSM